MRSVNNVAAIESLSKPYSGITGGNREEYLSQVNDCAL